MALVRYGVEPDTTAVAAGLQDRPWSMLEVAERMDDCCRLAA